MIYSYKLKAGTKAALLSALESKGIVFTDAEGEVTQNPSRYHYSSTGCLACVWLGKLVDQSAVVDDDGAVVEAETYLPGWHCDVLMSAETVFDCDVVNPLSPRHGFAGI